MQIKNKHTNTKCIVNKNLLLYCFTSICGVRNKKQAIKMSNQIILRHYKIAQMPYLFTVNKEF